MPILYFSRFCDYSKNLLIELKNNNLLKEISLICIDNNKVPYNIKEVPTLILEDDPERLITYSQAFNWINYKKLMKSKQSNLQVNKKQNVENKKINISNEKEGKDYDLLETAYSEPEKVNNLKRDGKSEINYDNFTITPKIKSKENFIDYNQYNIEDNIGNINKNKINNGNVDNELENLQKLRRMDDSLNKSKRY